jgi:hypothetical protein
MRLARSTGRTPADVGTHHHHDHDNDRTDRSDDNHADLGRAVHHTDHPIGLDEPSAHYHHDHARGHADFDHDDLERARELKPITPMVASVKTAGQS